MAFTAVLSTLAIEAFSQTPASAASAPYDPKLELDTLWVMVAGSLVFFMNAGFAMLEVGFCRAKNALIILAKNLIVFSISTIAFWMAGYAIMFGKGNDYFGEKGFFLLGEKSFQNFGIPLEAHFFFQLTFAGTAATIISGAVAERIKFNAYALFSFLFIFVYSIIGHLVWAENGLLYYTGFRDFAGSTVVHSVGGYAALVGIFFLGSRLGKYTDSSLEKKTEEYSYSFFSKKINDFSLDEYNANLAALGSLILWLGWFGFNAGSLLAADSGGIAHIIATTILAGATASIASTFLSWFLVKRRANLSFIINGILAGCVSITASCAYVSLPNASLIGFVGGVVVVLTSVFLDKLELDDVVGAVPVHLFCGIWGTLAVGLFSDPEVYKRLPDGVSVPEEGIAGIFYSGGDPELLADQIFGILVVAAVAIVFSAASWLLVGLALNVLGNVFTDQKSQYNPRSSLRVTEEVEYRGLSVLFSDSSPSEETTKERVNRLEKMLKDAGIGSRESK